uniref:Uncharacterized protein n=1 Tax=Arundo donax TaxID=35708 RepID=A0A0A9ESH5_ARUDO
MKTLPGSPRCRPGSSFTENRNCLDTSL